VTGGRVVYDFASPDLHGAGGPAVLLVATYGDLPGFRQVQVLQGRW